MYTVLLVIHTIVVLFLIGIVLIQRSDSDGTGLSGGGSQFMSGRASANLLTRTTSILAAVFMVSSLVLAMMVSNNNKDSILDRLDEAPVVTEPMEEGVPAEPAAPAAEGETKAPKEKAPAVPKPE